jgi:hypothetical protein
LRFSLSGTDARKFTVSAAALLSRRVIYLRGVGALLNGKSAFDVWRAPTPTFHANSKRISHYCHGFIIRNAWKWFFGNAGLRGFINAFPKRAEPSFANLS